MFEFCKILIKLKIEPYKLKIVDEINELPEKVSTDVHILSDQCLKITKYDSRFYV